MQTARLSKSLAVAAVALSFAVIAAPAHALLPASTDQARAQLASRAVMFQPPHAAPVPTAIGTTDEARRQAAAAELDSIEQRDAMLRGAPTTTDEARAEAAAQQ